MKRLGKMLLCAALAALLCAPSAMAEGDAEAELRAKLDSACGGGETEEFYCGDYDGDGISTLAVRRNGNEIFVSNSFRGGEADVRFYYGRPGEVMFTDTPATVFPAAPAAAACTGTSTQPAAGMRLS